MRKTSAFAMSNRLVSLPLTCFVAAEMSRRYQKALCDREAMVGVRPPERSPVSILYNTTPCANAMPTMAPVKTIRFSIINCSEIGGVFPVARRERRFEKSNAPATLIELRFQRGGR